MSQAKAAKPRLTIVCESYWPELTSTGQLITELAEGLAGDFEIELLSAQPRFNSQYEKRPKREERNGVVIHRLPATTFSKSSAAGRLINWMSFAVSLTFAVATRWQRRSYLYLTNPPPAPWTLVLARWLRHPAYVLVYDLYPDLAEAIGAVKEGSMVSRCFDAINRFAFRRASGLIALGEDMKAVLSEKAAKTPVTVIPNWANGSVISPRGKRASNFAKSQGLDDRFVFLYAGNLGLFQDLEILVEAANRLPSEGKPPMLVFVGNGGKRQKIEEMAAKSDRIRVYDWLPYEEIGDLYAAADVGLIALEPGVEMTNVPSKTYAILAAGKPFLAVCNSSKDLHALADEGCGVCVPNDVEKVTQAMRELLEDAGCRESMARHSREVFEDRFSSSVVFERYRTLLSSTGA